jgi:MYXO-CTERM domain-containing protein
VFRRAGEGGAYAWVWATEAGSGWTEVGSGLTAENTGVGDGSGLDVHVIGDGLLWADGDGGLRFVLAGPGGWRTFVQPLPAVARTVRLEVDGERLLALVGTEDNGVYVATLSLADADADGVAAAFDGCPELADPAQLDADADAVGDACDCGDDGQCTGWTDAGGFCDASTPARTDPDCDLCAVGPDADADGVTDACDACPDDPDKVEPGACGCGVADPCAEAPVDEGCGCATRDAPGGLAGLALLALAWRRRR